MHDLKKFHPLLLSLLSGLLLFAAWPPSPLTFLAFVAFVPLLWLEQQKQRKGKFFGWVYLTMVLWNVSTTWWVWNASPPGAAGAILANSLLMCLPWLGFRFIKKRLGDKAGYGSLITLWLSFEYLHLQDWGLSWPWLTLGNVFSTHPSWVQWYEYTGASGGTLWILAGNILVFFLLRGSRTYALTLALVLLIPLLVSIWLIPPVTSGGSPAGTHHIVIVQPNIDPYEKIATGTFDANLQKLIRLSDESIDSQTTLVVWPETALYMENGINEETLKQNFFLNPLWDFLRRHPGINLMTGVESFKLYKNDPPKTARNIPGTNLYVESYNAAASFDSSGPIAFYHKSMLVPGVETLPPFLHFLDSWFEKFGGTTSGYTGQKDRTPLPTSNHSYSIAPAVCYESIYGEFMSKYIRNGADIICVITNDGWWGNTPGYHQHENYARLRAIETRRWILRSANTGVSCIIDPAGRVTSFQPWDKAATIKAEVPPATGMTFYVLYGDLISKAALVISVLLAIWVVAKISKQRG